jgi:hypothetical protein
MIGASRRDEFPVYRKKATLQKIRRRAFCKVALSLGGEGHESVSLERRPKPPDEGAGQQAPQDCVPLLLLHKKDAGHRATKRVSARLQRRMSLSRDPRFLSSRWSGDRFRCPCRGAGGSRRTAPARPRRSGMQFPSLSGSYFEACTSCAAEYHCDDTLARVSRRQAEQAQLHVVE